MNLFLLLQNLEIKQKKKRKKERKKRREKGKTRVHIVTEITI